MKLGYVPQLDGLRAFAVASVLVSHFIPTTTVINRIAPWGRLGVLLFFVLSGFLITRILLGERDSRDRGTRPWPSIARFFTRRVLRIFPIYFGTIGICVLVDYPPVTDHLAWHLTYLSNYSKPFLGGTYAGSVHLWSLCVEEQFYLFWPFVVMLAPRRRIAPLIVALILSAVGYKLFGSLLGLDWQQLTRPLPGCFESIGLGALLGAYCHEPNTYRRARARLLRLAARAGLPAALGLIALFSLLDDPKSHTPFVTLFDLSASLCFAWLIHGAATRPDSRVGRVLALRPIRYLGKISYGIYLYHLFLAMALIPAAIQLFDLSDALLTGWSRPIVLTATTVAVAVLSWHLVEKPLNGLKRHFPYS